MILSETLKAHQARVAEIVGELHELTREIKAEELTQTVGDLRNRLHEPFMFVIVGEVKAGKSSFVNALLDAGREITKVAPQPMTDTIQQIVYGETEQVSIINPYLKRITVPVEILKEIAIVDTPGTNTIVEHHQEITERFIPASDLIIFVFEAKNPYRQSAWEFFDYINDEWRKKIIFVLQQKDLMPDADLRVNLQGVHDQAVKKGISDPVVFAVSAKQELDGDHELSNIPQVREWIRENVTGGRAPLLKLQNNVSTGQNLNQRIASGLNERRRQYDADVAFRTDVTESLREQEAKSIKQVDILVENLLAAYDRITRDKERELEAELSFWSLLRRSFASMFNRDQSAKVRLEALARDLENDLNREMQRRLQSGVTDLADSIQDMAKTIDLKIRASRTILSNDHDIFADIAERRANVMRDLQEAFQRFLARTESFRDDDLFPKSADSLSPNLLQGGGLAAIGAIVMAVSSIPAFDITGGVLTSIGVLFAGVTTSIKKKNILKKFRQEVRDGHTQLETEMTQKLKAYVHMIRTRIEANFQKLDNLLESEHAQLERLEEKQQRIEWELGEMESEIEGMLEGTTVV